MSSMTATATGSDDGNDRSSHPENASTCKLCLDARHDACKTKKCGCGCRGPARTKKHDWLDPRFDDEIDLERAMGEAPPYALVVAACLNGVVDRDSKDAPWFFLGKFKTSAERPSTNDARWTLTCRRCKKSRRPKIATARIVVPARDAQKVEWLRKREVTIDASPEHVYRVGRCATCKGIYWFELLSGKK